MRQVYIVRIAFDLIPFSARGSNSLMLPQRRRLLEEGGGGGRLLLFDITIGPTTVMRQVHIVRIAFDLIPFSARGSNSLMLP